MIMSINSAFFHICQNPFMSHIKILSNKSLFISKYFCQTDCKLHKKLSIKKVQLFMLSLIKLRIKSVKKTNRKYRIGYIWLVTIKFKWFTINATIFFHLISILGVELKCGRIIHLYNLARTCKKQQQQQKINKKP